MPVITFDDGTLHGERTVRCNSCPKTIRIKIVADVRAEGHPGPQILGAMDGALAKVADAIGWTNLDKALYADCPLHKASV